MGGLTAAVAFARKGFKEVHVYENAPALGFVGAGIQIAPNLIRVLDGFGIWQGSALQREATAVKEVRVIEGPSDRELARVSMADIGPKYGYLHYVGHRASLANVLYDAAKSEPNVHFHFDQTLQSIESYEPGNTTFVVKDSAGVEQTVETDILIGADGIKSAVRESMLSGLGLKADVEETGTAAYRIILERKQMEPYPELLELVDSDTVRRWIGPRRHLIAYPIHNHTLYNIATTQPDVNFAGSINSTWTNKADKEAMKKVYADFCPVVQKLLDLVPEGGVVEWRLRSHKPLETWTRGGVALLGDACHPTLPHLSQGAAMAIEDGAILAEVVSLVPNGGADRRDIAQTLKVYELLRKERTSTLVDLAAASARTLHLDEGKAKEQRDREFEAAMKSGKPLPDKWVSPEVQQMMFTYDGLSDARNRFRELYASLQQGSVRHGGLKI
jgi:salicylate hydroxylase